MEIADAIRPGETSLHSLALVPTTNAYLRHDAAVFRGLLRVNLPRKNAKRQRGEQKFLGTCPIPTLIPSQRKTATRLLQHSKKISYDPQ